MRTTYDFIENVPEGVRPYLRRQVQAWIERRDYPVCAFTLPNGESVDLCQRPWPAWRGAVRLVTVGAERDSDEEILLKFLDERHKYPRPPLVDVVAEMTDIDAIASLGGQCCMKALAYSVVTFVCIVISIGGLFDLLFPVAFISAYWSWKRCIDMRHCEFRIAEIGLAKRGHDMRSYMLLDGWAVE